MWHPQPYFITRQIFTVINDIYRNVRSVRRGLFIACTQGKLRLAYMSPESLRLVLHFIFILLFIFSFKTYLKLVFTIVDSKMLIHTNYVQDKYTYYKRKNN